jgi:hypothetical protein
MPAWYMRDDLPQRTYRRTLRVPYGEKNMAKQAGAKWDSLGRTWFIDSPHLLKKVERWLPREKPAGKQEGSAGNYGRRSAAETGSGSSHPTPV